MADDRDSEPNASSDKSPSAPDQGSWSVSIDSDDYEVLGFLQMCIEKRFHKAVQERFEKETRLAGTAYWIHTGAGGSPKMEGQPDAPRYCYRQGARIMGWSAHGSKCGGFREGDDNSVILAALRKTVANQQNAFPLAEHVGLFAIEVNGNPEIFFFHGE